MATAAALPTECRHAVKRSKGGRVMRRLYTILMILTTLSIFVSCEVVGDGLTNVEVSNETAVTPSSMIAPCSHSLMHNPCTGQFSMCPHKFPSIFTAIITP